MQLDWPGTLYVDQAGIELAVLLAVQHWDHRCMP